MMHDQQVCFRHNGHFDGREAGVHGGGDSRYGARVLDLQSVHRAVVVLDLARAQQGIAVSDDGGERNFRHWVIKSKFGKRAKHFCQFTPRISRIVVGWPQETEVVFELRTLLKHDSKWILGNPSHRLRNSAKLRN